MSYSYYLSFLKESNFFLYKLRSNTPLNIIFQLFEWSEHYTVTNKKSNWVKLLTSFVLRMRNYVPGQVHSKHHTYGKFLSSKIENNIYGTIYIQIHSPRSWYWLVANWHKKWLSSNLLKVIGMTTSMSKVVRGHVYIVTHQRSRLYSMAWQICTMLSRPMSTIMSVQL